MDNHVTIIAEIGINHNGSLDIAKKLIEGAKWCGCNAVKFQKRTIDKVYSKEELSKPRESPWGNTYRVQKEGLEFGEKEYNEIDRFCKEKKISWFASAWDLESVEFLKKYNLPYNKIASPMLTHKELIDAIAKQKKYTFISTGMSTLEEITKAVIRFKGLECSFELMHCNSAYPMDDKDANLNVIPYLRKLYLCNVGYSSHSPSILIPVYAVALGATSIEVHITLDRAMYGTDQAASIAIDGLMKMVKYIRAAEEIMGDGIKTVTVAEQKIKEKLRRTQDYEPS